MADSSRTIEAVDETIRSRRSVRQFLATPVPIATVMEILDVAARAPSGHNTQAWQVHVLTGETLRDLCAELVAAAQDAEAMSRLRPEFDSYPAQWVSPYIDRRRQVGKDMYTLLGIPRGDSAGMQAQLARNYAFFGAPVGLIFTLQRVMLPGSVLDLGMFMQSVMLAARARGLDSCPQAAFAPFHQRIARRVALDAQQAVVCGMSLGHADTDAPVNRVRTSREPAASFTVIHA
jgi:nitroreductase